MERRIKNNRYKNGGSSKDKWISDKIRLLEHEDKGRSHEQNIAIAFNMWNQNHKQIGGNYYENNNPYFMQNPGDIRMQGLNQGVSYSPQPITLPQQTNQVDFGNYSNQLSQKYPLPDTKVNGFTYNPNELSPYSTPPQITAPNTYNIQDTGSEYIQGDNNGDGIVDEKDNYDMYGRPLQPPNPAVTENFSYFNPYGGFDIPSAAYRLGQGIGTGNAFDIGVSGLKLATGLGRNVVSGLGVANRREQILNEYQQKARKASVPATQSMEIGGYFQKGGIHLDPENKGKFTETARRAGYTDVQNFANHVLNNPDKYDTITIQRANFARNSANWEKQDGGQQATPSPEEIINAYAQSTGQNPQEIISQLQQLPEEQQAQAIQEMLSVLQQGQTSQEQPVMQNGGRLKKKEENKIATGEYVAEVPEGEKVAELERDEYLKKPDGIIQKVLGESHENGGTELTAEQLPDDSQIISDHLKIGKNGTKKFNDEYDLGVKSTDTYATVIDKFNKKTGLDKIVKEQEELASKLRKQADKLLHNPNLENTIKININFLTEEFQELEQEKLPIIEARKNFFEEVFNVQEASKVSHNAEEVMQNGGIYNGDMIVEYSKKYNLPQEKVTELLATFKNGGFEEYQVGGKKVGVTSNINPYSTNVREQQSANPEAYGVVKTQEALQNLYNNFPDIINSDAGFKQLIDVDTKGNVKLKGNIPLNKQSQIVGNIQRKIDENMKDSAQTIINNPENFSPDAVREAQRYISEETFLPDTTTETDQARAIRGYDEKLGNFTAGRYSMQINLVTPEEKQLLADNGILTVKQLKNSPIRAKLSAPSIKNLDNIEGLIGDTSADYGIAEITPEARPLATTPSPTNQRQPFTQNKEINTYGLLNLPDQSPLLPDSLQGALKINRRYDRIEAPLVSPDAQVNEIRRQEAATMESLNSLPDAQRAAAIAQIQANTQNQLNSVMGQVAGQNQAAIFQANAANAQIQAREEDARANDLLSYEGRILKADAITQQNLRNYYNTARKVNLGNYNTVNSVNLINSMYDNARYTPDGVAMTNLEIAPNYGNMTPDRYQELQNAKKVMNRFNVETKAKKKRFGGKK